jgi:CDP-paratose synthetase
MNILVTGGTGFIGVNLIRKLQNNNHEVFLLVRPNSNRSNIAIKHIFEFQDNLYQLTNYLVENNIDGIIHLASLYLAQHTPEDIKELVLSNIYLGTALLEASKYSKVKWFINTGTFWQNYISDSKEYCPVNLYAASKQAFIDLSKFYTETSNIQFVTLKLCDTFGPKDSRPKILNLFKRISESQEILAMSSGEQLLDILYIDDVVAGFICLVNNIKEGILLDSEYVLCAKKRYTLKELADVYSRVSGKKLNIEWGGRPYRDREVMQPWNNGILLPGWMPNYDIETGIKMFLGLR